MKHQYFLIGYRTTIGKRGFKFIDSINEDNLRNALKEFEKRNKFKTLLRKYDLTIAKAESFIQ